jgi:brefeldin A-inhibited guanine nucleotide-exchange protein
MTKAKRGRLTGSKRRLRSFRKYPQQTFWSRKTNPFGASLCADIIRSYTLLDEETQTRNIVAWRPVVVDVMEGYTNFPRDSFDKHIETFYPLAVALLERDIGTDIRGALWSLLRRVGEVRLGLVELMPTPSATPTSPGTAKSFEWSRRSSRTGR